MAHGLVVKRGAMGCASGSKAEGKNGGGVGSRRIFAPHFKLQVLDSYRTDADCKGNQRATARKYGIHRRQIQKWLQVEGNLRSSVGAPKQPALEARQRGGGCEPDEEAAPRVPLDFSTHSRSSPSPPPDPAAPMDLSLKRPTSLAAGTSSAPATYAYPSPPRAPTPPSLARPHPDVWDLSTKRKCQPEAPFQINSSPGSHSPTSTTPKPVKLFKPYLDDAYTPEDKPDLPPCCSAALTTCDVYYYNNNNNVCDIKSEYGSYTLHELQPKNYYYSFPAYQGTEYEMGSGFYEESYLQGGAVPLKQRHSYSLDFKLRAIECYYQDSVCKGNQRAVATKYNIHRRQVQKWLKQADELRQKNETIKHQTVR